MLKINIKPRVLKSILESAKSGASTKINEVFNDKSTGALSEYNDETTVSGVGKEFAVENFAKSRQVVVTQFLKTLKYINKVDDYYDNLMWLMTARIAQAKDREKEIELIKKILLLRIWWLIKGLIRWPTR